MSQPSDLGGCLSRVRLDLWARRRSGVFAGFGLGGRFGAGIATWYDGRFRAGFVRRCRHARKYPTGSAGCQRRLASPPTERALVAAQMSVHMSSQPGRCRRKRHGFALSRIRLTRFGDAAVDGVANGRALTRDSTRSAEPDGPGDASHQGARTRIDSHQVVAIVLQVPCDGATDG